MRFLLVALMIAGTACPEVDAGLFGRRCRSNQKRCVCYQYNCCQTSGCHAVQSCGVVAGACGVSETTVDVAGEQPVPPAAPEEPPADLPVESADPPTDLPEDCPDCQGADQDQVLPTPDNIGSQQPQTPPSPQAPASEPTHGEALAAMTAYINANGIESVCEMKTRIAAYGRVIDSLQQEEKLEVAGGVRVCFPSVEKWQSSPQVRNQIITIFRNNGVMK